MKLGLKINTYRTARNNVQSSLTSTIIMKIKFSWPKKKLKVVMFETYFSKTCNTFIEK